MDRIERSYDSHDRVVEARSLDASGAPLDRVTWQYDADGHLTESTQEHDVGVSLSVKAQYLPGPGVNQHFPKRLDRITTNKSVKDCPGIFVGDETMTSAILDRLLHRSVVLNVRGRSYRLQDLERLFK